MVTEKDTISFHLPLLVNSKRANNGNKLYPETNSDPLSTFCGEFQKETFSREGRQRSLSEFAGRVNIRPPG